MLSVIIFCECGESSADSDDIKVAEATIKQ